MGFILQQDIMDNIYKILNLIHYAKTNQVGSSVILSLDFEKAFDQVKIP